MQRGGEGSAGERRKRSHGSITGYAVQQHPHRDSRDEQLVGMVTCHMNALNGCTAERLDAEVHVARGHAAVFIHCLILNSALTSYSTHMSAFSLALASLGPPLSSPSATHRASDCPLWLSARPSCVKQHVSGPGSTMPFAAWQPVFCSRNHSRSTFIHSFLLEPSLHS